MAITLRGASESGRGRRHLLARKTIDAIAWNRAHVVNLRFSFQPTRKEGTDNMIANCEVLDAFTYRDNLSRSIGHWNTRHWGRPHSADYRVIVVVQRTRLDPDGNLACFRG